jgi:hypothetical protein
MLAQVCCLHSGCFFHPPPFAGFLLSDCLRQAAPNGALSTHVSITMCTALTFKWHCTVVPCRLPFTVSCPLLCPQRASLRATQTSPTSSDPHHPTASAGGSPTACCSTLEHWSGCCAMQGGCCSWHLQQCSWHPLLLRLLCRRRVCTGSMLRQSVRQRMWLLLQQSAACRAPGVPQHVHVPNIVWHTMRLVAEHNPL